METKLKAFIVDDEVQSRNVLANLLKQYFPDIIIAGEAGNVEEALQGILSLQPRMVFLDIQMRGETGFDLLRRLPKIDFDLIFTTAHDQYAIKAFRFNAVDYLLKPIIADEFMVAVTKVKERNSKAALSTREQMEKLYSDLHNPGKVHDKISIPTAEGFIIIPVRDILYCRASSNYTEFFLDGKKSILSGYTLKQYDEMLSGHSFFRAHRSYLINLTHVKMFRKGEGGIIVMSNGDEVELSRNHRESFLQFFKGD